MAKLFGPSFKELAEKESALKRKLKENGEVKATIPVPLKRKLSLQEKYLIIFSSIFLTVVLVVAISIVYSKATMPKANYDGFKSAMSTYINENSSISDVVINDRDTFKAIVNDDWYNSTEIDKLRFCNNLHDTIYAYAVQYDLIYRDSDNVYVSFYDLTDIKVAEQDMGEFSILH